MLGLDKLDEELVSAQVLSKLDEEPALELDKLVFGLVLEQVEFGKLALELV